MTLGCPDCGVTFEDRKKYCPECDAELEVVNAPSEPDDPKSGDV